MRSLANVLKGQAGENPAARRKGGSKFGQIWTTRAVAGRAQLPFTKHQPQAKPHSNKKLTQLILIFRMRWTRAAFLAAFSDGFSEAFLFSFATIRAFLLNFR